jgi:hypothetical protein
VSLYNKFRDYIEASLDSRIAENQRRAEDMTKSEAAAPVDAAVNSNHDLVKKLFPDGTIGRKGLIFDPFSGNDLGGGLFKQKVGFLSNPLLKLAARRNPVVSTIIHTRSSQVGAFCRPQVDKHDIGYVIKPTNPQAQTDPNDVQKIQEFLQNCGMKEKRNDNDKMTLDQWGYIVTSDMLRYGHTAVERTYLRDGRLYGFFPLASESIFYAAHTVTDRFLRDEKKATRAGLGNDKDLVATAAEDEDQENDVEYVQVIQGRVTETFTRKELVFARINMESDLDLNGYAISPLERAMMMVTNHLKIENHQAQFFTHGMASRGVMVIQGDVAPSNLKALQAQWTQQVTGPVNAWRTPILAGIKGVQWVPLTATNRDMEYAAYQDHVLRMICAAFAISPEEIGLDYLSRGTEQRSMSESSNEWKISASRERGLRPILTRIEAIINEEILPAFDPELARKYQFCFAGLDAETRDEENQRLGMELSTYKTLNQVLKEAGMPELQLGGNLILNPSFLAYAEKNMPKGMFMELFMGIQGASQRPDLQYIPDPLWFQWQQFQMQMMQQQAAAAAAAEDGGDDGGGQGGGQPQGEDGQEQADPEAQRAQAAAMAQGIENFMAANPQLFKSMSDNLSKSHPSVKVTPISAYLLKEYKKAGNRLVKDVLEILKEEAIEHDHGDDKE